MFDAQDTLVISAWRREGLLLNDWYEQGNTFATGPRALSLGTAAGGSGEGELSFGSLVLRP